MKAGTLCFAKWTEDNVWYNATIEDIKTDDITVLFIDYGNTAVEYSLTNNEKAFDIFKMITFQQSRN